MTALPTDHHSSENSRASLAMLTASTLHCQRHAMGHGAVVYCREGSAEAVVNFDRFALQPHTVLTLFPGDAVMWQQVSPDVRLEVLRYEPDVLREASMQMEHSVYSHLRHHRLCADTTIARAVAGHMMGLLRYYFEVQQCQSIGRIVVLQLTTFFLGFHDHVSSLPMTADARVSPRVEELFGRFMEAVETDYQQAREVRHYADRLCITPKYLSIIVAQKTGLTPKRVVDEYVVLQIKLLLRTTHMTVRQLATHFSFSDPSFFIRYFKAHTGVSPLAYRMNNME